jgi:hypothetical protein
MSNFEFEDAVGCLGCGFVVLQGLVMLVITFVWLFSHLRWV